MKRVIVSYEVIIGYGYKYSWFYVRKYVDIEYLDDVFLFWIRLF